MTELDDALRYFSGRAATTYGVAGSNPFQTPEKPMTPQERITKAQADLESALVAQAAQEKHDALKARLAYHQKLAAATKGLIDQASDLLLEGARAGTFESLATFRKELQPLAESYGLKIVLVGDKSVATLVVA